MAYGETMKALSVKQPWANLIAFGKKTIETRTWSTKYRGPILVISSAKPDIYPSGHAVTIVDIIGCREMTEEDENAACCKVYPKAKSWLLDNIRPIKPVPMKGALSIFNVPYEIGDFKTIDMDFVISEMMRMEEDTKIGIVVDTDYFQWIYNIGESIQWKG